MSLVASETLKSSKLACKKLAEFFSFLPWVNYLRGDLCAGGKSVGVGDFFITEAYLTTFVSNIFSFDQLLSDPGHPGVGG